MPIAIAAPTAVRSAVETLADVVGRLGNIPLERILFSPHMGTATEENVLEWESKTGRLCELVDGVLVEKAMGYHESQLAALLIGYLMMYMETMDEDPGTILAPDGLVRVESGQVRSPDVSYILWSHFPGRVRPAGAILDMAPDLAVEILSPSNTTTEMDRKRREYFGGGSKQVWQVYPETRRVRIYTAVDQCTELGEDDTIDGGDLLPGFTLSIRRWFDRAGQAPQA